MKNVLKKLLEARKGLSSLEKDGRNLFQKYSYVTENQVMSAIKPVLDELGVIFSYSAEVTDMRDMGKMLLTTVKITYNFIDVETGEALTGYSYGQGSDTGDKGIYKAITGGLKYIFMKNFLMPSDDDPENDSREHQPQPEIQNNPVMANFKQNYQAQSGRVEKKVGDKCEKCGVGVYVKSATTGKIYCNNKCWLKQEPVINVPNEPFGR